MPVIDNKANSKKTKQNSKKKNFFNESTHTKKDHFIWAKFFKLTKK